ncbi:ribonuclease HI [Nocardia sp. NPDC055053]
MAESGERIVEIYTDGACLGNPGPGGWGAILRYGDREKQLYGGIPATTNNRMELMAAIRALEALTRPSTVRLYSDSQYVVLGVTNSLRRWQANGWLTKSKRAVKNIDLWEQLAEVLGRHTVEWVWVRGHAGHVDNERADRLAVKGAEEARSMASAEPAPGLLPYHPSDLFGTADSAAAAVVGSASTPEQVLEEELCRHELGPGQCDYCRALPPGVLARGYRTAGGRAYHNDRRCQWLHEGQLRSARSGREVHDIVAVSWYAVGPAELAPCEWCCTPQWIARNRHLHAQALPTVRPV